MRGGQPGLRTPMKIMETTECPLLTVARWNDVDVDYLNTVAALTRQLPAVLRVRVDWKNCELEILHQDSSRERIKKFISSCCWQVMSSRLENP